LLPYKILTSEDVLGSEKGERGGLFELVQKLSYLDTELIKGHGISRCCFKNVITITSIKVFDVNTRVSLFQFEDVLRRKESCGYFEFDL
jgi:hypothetical protein